VPDPRIDAGPVHPHQRFARRVNPDRDSTARHAWHTDRALPACPPPMTRAAQLRGRQSAPRVAAVAGSGGHGVGFGEVDLRVDAAAAPLAELRRLHTLHRTYPHLAPQLTPAGLYTDLAEIDAVLALTPDDDTVLGAAGLALARCGWLTVAAAFLTRLAAREPRTTLRLQRLADSGRLDPATAHTLLQMIESR
jgi:hypothetical protein